MKALLLALLVAYLLAMWWLRQRKKDPGPSFRPWQVRLKPKQKR